ncbi:hypothetical protein UB39_21910, partial [Photobacterium angustum]
TAGGQEAVSITMTPSSLANGDVTVDLAIKQSLPLDHLNADGKFVDVTDGKITIDVPVQMQDTDGDPLMTGDKPTPINVTININDGANPEFGIDKGITINETTDADKEMQGQIPLDVGSDYIQTIHFNATQDGLANITSNGEKTTFTVNGNVLTVVDADSNPVMVVTIANDGTYTVKVTGPVDQNSADIADIKLDVTATDKDGDTAQGELNITIKDGTDASGEGVVANITITEGDIEYPNTNKGYPVSADTHFTVNATDDALVANSLKVADSAQADLVKELN